VNRTLLLLLCLIAALVGWRVSLNTSHDHPRASPPVTPRIEGSKVYFVPIGNFPNEQIVHLVRYYDEKYGLKIATLRSISLDSSTRDASRQQLMSESALSSVRGALPEYANDPKSILIAFTSEDMYPTAKDWQFAFGWREGATRSAIVSTARLNLPDEGGTASSDLMATRLRKIVTKDIGILYFGLPQSTDPKSVLYNGIMGIEELDQQSEEF
jgi:predicted Zn-dependent protease